MCKCRGDDIEKEDQNGELTHSFDELLPVFINDAFWETDFPKTYVLVHLLGIFGVEWAPAAAHLE